MLPIIERYLVSALITFLSVFFTVLGANLATLSIPTITFSAITAILFAAIRTAVKAAFEAMSGQKT